MNATIIYVCFILFYIFNFCFVLNTVKQKGFTVECSNELKYTFIVFTIFVNVLFTVFYINFERNNNKMFFFSFNNLNFDLFSQVWLIFWKYTVVISGWEYRVSFTHKCSYWWNKSYLTHGTRRAGTVRGPQTALLRNTRKNTLQIMQDKPRNWADILLSNLIVLVTLQLSQFSLFPLT